VHKRALGLAVAAILGAVLVSASGAATTKAQKVAKIDVSTRASVVHYLRSIHVNAKHAVIQRGLRNYAGAHCPGKHWTCASTKHTVVQIAKRGGQNRYACTTAKCSVVQFGGASRALRAGRAVATTVLPTPVNNASCVKITGITQSCVINQTNPVNATGTNKAVVWMVTPKLTGLTQSANYTASITQGPTSGSSSVWNLSCVKQSVSIDGSTTKTNGATTTVTNNAHESIVVRQNSRSGDNTVMGAKNTGNTYDCMTDSLGNLDTSSPATQDQTLTSVVTSKGPITQNQDTTYSLCGDGVTGEYANLCFDVKQNQAAGFKCTNSTSCPASGANSAIFTQTSTQAAIANTTKGPVFQTQSTPLCSTVSAPTNAPADCVVPGGLVGTVDQDSSGISIATPTQIETQCEDAKASGLSLTNCLPTPPQVPSPPDSVSIPGGLHQTQYGPVGVGNIRQPDPVGVHFSHLKGLGQAHQTGNGSDHYTITQTSTQNADQGATQLNLGQADCTTDGQCKANQTTTTNGGTTKDGYTAPSIGNLNINCPTSGACVPTPPPTPTLLTMPPNTHFASSGVFTWTDDASGGIAYKCSVDGVLPFTDCTSGDSVTSTYGAHSFQVEAVDLFGGNASPPTTEYDWTNVPPTPTIDSGPGPTTSPDALFTFSDSDTSLSFVCSLDTSAYSACSSGQTYNALDPGLHTFSVKATDLASPTAHLSAAASTQWTISSDNPNVLIAGAGDAAFGGDTSPYAAEPNDNIANALTAAGYTVTELATLPADLSSFGQVWWVDSNPPTGGEQSQLVAFAESGRGVFLTGEWDTFGASLNAADQSMVNTIVTAGGITLGGSGCCTGTPVAYSVNSGVVGNLATAPHTLTTWTPTYPGLISGMAASSVFASDAPTEVAAAAWNRAGTVGEGRLAVFMDINWAQAAWEGANFSDVAENVAFFLSGLSSPPAAPLAPAMRLSAIGSRMLGVSAPAAPRAPRAGLSASGR